MSDWLMKVIKAEAERRSSWRPRMTAPVGPPIVGRADSRGHGTAIGPGRIARGGLDVRPGAFD